MSRRIQTPPVCLLRWYVRCPSLGMQGDPLHTSHESIITRTMIAGRSSTINTTSAYPDEGERIIQKMPDHSRSQNANRFASGSHNLIRGSQRRTHPVKPPLTTNLEPLATKDGFVNTGTSNFKGMRAPALVGITESLPQDIVKGTSISSIL